MKHIPGPWKVMACPDNAGKHPYHDSRWIVSANAEVERGHDERSWGLSQGSLIAQMRDVDPVNARLIAAAPELLEALEVLLGKYNAVMGGDSLDPNRGKTIWEKRALAAIAKAKGSL